LFEVFPTKLDLYKKKLFEVGQEFKTKEATKTGQLCLVDSKFINLNISCHLYEHLSLIDFKYS